MRLALVLPILLALAGGAQGPVTPDLSAYNRSSGVEVARDDRGLRVRWPMERGDFGEFSLDLRPGRPLINALGISGGRAEAAAPLLRDVDPAAWVTVGSREAPAGRPPEMSIWNVFFDHPGKRPYTTHQAALNLRRAAVRSEGRRTTVVLGDVNAGPFTGELHVTVYPGAPLLHVETVLSTREDARAFIYDAGLLAERPSWLRSAWRDTEGKLQRLPAAPQHVDRSLAVRHRALMVESEAGSVACFPPPHQFFFPTDWTDNFRYVWTGPGHLGAGARTGFGVRQDPINRGSFVPWFNAPPGTKQRLGVLYLLSRGGAEQALRETLRYTHDDRFPELTGHRTFTSHYHMAVAVTAMERARQGQAPELPEFVDVFKGLGVDALHLGEFHGDGHPGDPGPLRLPEMEAMFRECRRLSGPDFLVIPGEEGNDYLGIREPGKHPGHWMSLFPRPVYWTMRRAPDQPLVEADPRYGTVRHVGSRDDMVALLRREKGLAWTAHPRIKASSWTPDIFRREEFFQADYWLGAAWKAMPADLSRERLGERCLDLLDDMANWGTPKYLPGEVDVFKIGHTHELYGHMNINYLRLDRLPRYDDGWQPILDVLRAGQFFTTTGEVLIREFTVGGKESGETLAPGETKDPEVRVELSWTFPLRFAEVISGDGTRVYRDRVDLSDTGPFGRRTLTLRPDLRGRRWARFEVWDIAANGAYTQPVWIR